MTLADVGALSLCSDGVVVDRAKGARHTSTFSLYPIAKRAEAKFQRDAFCANGNAATFGCLQFLTGPSHTRPYNPSLPSLIVAPSRSIGRGKADEVGVWGEWDGSRIVGGELLFLELEKSLPWALGSPEEGERDFGEGGVRLRGMEAAIRRDSEAGNRREGALGRELVCCSLQHASRGGVNAVKSSVL